MKKALFYSLLLAGCLGMTTACSDDDNETPATEENGGNGNEDGGGQKPPTIMTAEDAQNEFDRVGRELMNKIDASKFDPVVTLARFCYNKFGDGENNRSYDGYGTSPSADLKAIMRHISTTAQGDFAGVASLKRLVETYRFNDYCGIFTWNEYRNRWDEEASTNELTYKFNHNGTPCVVTVKAGGAEHTWTVKESHGTTVDYVKIPTQLTATVTEGSTVLAQFTLNVPQCDQNGKDYRLNAELKVSEYAISGEVTDNNTTAKATCHLSRGSEKLIESVFEANGSALADDNAFVKEEFGTDNVKDGKATCTLLGSINLNIQADNTDDLTSQLDFDGNYEYYEYKSFGASEPYIYRHSDKATAEKEARRAADAANRYVVSNITFASGDYKPGVEWEAYLSDEQNYSWGDGNYYTREEYGKWSIRPVIVFEDDSRYTFDNYFNETRFSSLISVFESLMEDFEDLGK